MIWFRHISKAVIISTMKNLSLATLLIFSCSTAWAADFDKGLAAYKAGDFATALAEWKPLAEQGDASSQFNLGVVYDLGKGVLEDDDDLSRIMWVGDADLKTKTFSVKVWELDQQ